MRSLYPKLLLLLTVSCVTHDFDNTSPAESLRLASALCKKNYAEMQWYKTLLQDIRSDQALVGDIYSVEVDGNRIFIHQPMIMSCWACVLYDCDGNKIPPNAIAPYHPHIKMTPENRIYKAQ